MDAIRVQFTGYEQSLHGFIVIQHVLFFFPHTFFLPSCRYFHHIYYLKSSGVLFLLAVSKICAVDPLEFPLISNTLLLSSCLAYWTPFPIFFSVLINQFCKY